MKFEITEGQILPILLLIAGFCLGFIVNGCLSGDIITSLEKQITDQNETISLMQENLTYHTLQPYTFINVTKEETLTNSSGVISVDNILYTVTVNTTSGPRTIVTDNSDFLKYKTGDTVFLTRSDVRE